MGVFADAGHFTPTVFTAHKHVFKYMCALHGKSFAATPLIIRATVGFQFIQTWWLPTVVSKEGHARMRFEFKGSCRGRRANPHDIDFETV